MIEPISDNKYASAFYRRLLVAMIIKRHPMISCNGIQRILGWHINTIRKNVKGLSDIGVHVERKGSAKTGGYTLYDWGAINSDWVDQNFDKVLSLFEGAEDHESEQLNEDRR